LQEEEAKAEKEYQEERKKKFTTVRDTLPPLRKLTFVHPRRCRRPLLTEFAASRK
jgi:hypothetical protein